MSFQFVDPFSWYSSKATHLSTIWYVREHLTQSYGKKRVAFGVENNKEEQKVERMPTIANFRVIITKLNHS